MNFRHDHLIGELYEAWPQAGRTTYGYNDTLLQLLEGGYLIFPAHFRPVSLAHGCSFIKFDVIHVCSELAQIVRLLVWRDHATTAATAAGVQSQSVHVHAVDHFTGQKHSSAIHMLNSFRTSRTGLEWIL